MNFGPCFFGDLLDISADGFFASEACPEEAQEKLRRQLQGLGIFGEGDPCGWPDIGCQDCEVKKIQCNEAVGDLRSVKDMTGLYALFLRGQVTGNLTELSQLEKLQELVLSNTQVVGNISELSKLEGLRVLDLSNTQVVGNISELSKMNKLRRLDLSQTDVLGEIGVIRKMPGLTRVVLSRTAVSGDLEDLLRGDCCKGLWELHLGVPALVFVVWFYHVKSGFGVLQLLVL